MLAVAHGCAVVGIDGIPVAVQVDFNPRAHTPSFTIVGLPDNAVRESRERVRTAIKNSSLQFPLKVYTVNLAPADLPKHSTAYDLAIAVGILAATDQAPLEAVDGAMFVGELNLDGRVGHVQGVLPMALTARDNGFTTLYVPEEDAPQAALIQGVRVIPVKTLGQLVEHFYGMNKIAPLVIDPADEVTRPIPTDVVDFCDIKGQQQVKRALEIAAAGGHNLRMVGSPGCGKTLLARAMPTILPRLSLEEALEVTRIYSVSDMMPPGQSLIQQRPFQAPHHTISKHGLVGGGTIPRPGSVSLCHRGVLFLDEAVEFPSTVLELLRQPMEDRCVTISRVKGAVTFPANFVLVMAHNPCPCGYLGDARQPCTCTASIIERYQAKLSGPLLDRIDMHLNVKRVDYDKLMSDERAESSATVRERVEKARTRQRERFAGMAGVYCNSDMDAGLVQRCASMSEEAKKVLDASTRKMGLSARSYHRVIKLALTIADLAAHDRIEVVDVAEALQYRLER
jgi:magnesium chelatase family protein